MRPKILFEDDVLLVIDKPTGVVVNRAESVKTKTVQDWASVYLKIQNPNDKVQIGKNLAFGINNLDFYKRNGIVHRIDKETSGILLIAKNPDAFAELQRQFKAREVEKTYLALVHGEVEPRSGMIKAPVGRLPWNRERFGVLPGGREAETRYQVLDIKYRVTDKKQADYFSLVEFYPKTGRTHQIRVHAKYIYHPLVGDAFYAGRKTARRDRVWCPRLFLHAAKISFLHPKTKTRVLVESPLPSDLRSCLESLEQTP